MDSTRNSRKRRKMDRGENSRKQRKMDSTRNSRERRKMDNTGTAENKGRWTVQGTAENEEKWTETENSGGAKEIWMRESSEDRREERGAGQGEAQGSTYGLLEVAVAWAGGAAAAGEATYPRVTLGTSVTLGLG
ncbi:hypothetical protein NDU88_002727 [Pleurodeles waltl]|uniref:Uncharacterized protein n=1 Tax=Pleurodeles waltl TaxID=8319 RepID=A0AAV7RFC8_PLEWA|nr:hypothetical protein NDU88_002727 [Pleurodeles waltl]